MLEGEWAGPKRHANGQVKGRGTDSLLHGPRTQRQDSESSLPRFWCRKNKQEMVWGTLVPRAVLNPYFQFHCFEKLQQVISNDHDNGQCLCPPQNSYVEILTLSVMVLGSGGLCQEVR